VTRRPPLSLASAAVVGLAFLVLPLVGLLARTPWSDFWTLVTSAEARTALRLSVECSLGAVAFALVTGIPLAWLLARRDFPGKALVRALVTVPLVLPPVVGGVALLFAFGERGVLPLHIAFTTWGAMAAEAFVAMPFLVLSVEGAIASLDDRYEDVAATLGAGPVTVFRRVTLPLVAPGLAAGTWLGELGVGDLASRRPGQLSGGQAQKVALARALARRPQVLLLDEPLAALDAEARGDVRRALRQHLADFAGVTLLVTHDPVDAMALADRVLALEAGAVVQDAAPAEVARAPRSPWLGRLIGVNAYRGVLTGDRMTLDDGGALSVADTADRAEAVAVVAPQAVTLHPARPESSARNAWPVTVTELAADGHRVRVRCAGHPDVVAEVTPGAVNELGLAEGASVWASVKATEITEVLL
jgi:molybdopterin-binding protein